MQETILSSLSSVNAELLLFIKKKKVSTTSRKSEKQKQMLHRVRVPHRVGESCLFIIIVYERKENGNGKGFLALLDFHVVSIL